MNIIYPVFAFLFGAVFGSFMNVLIYRMPRSLSIVTPRSFCPKCKKPIPAYENIPILSYALLRGRCARCRAPISWQYPAVEAMTGLVFLFLFLRYGPSFDFLFFLFFFCGLIVISGIDFSHQEIALEIAIPGIVIGILYQLTKHNLLFGIIGAAFGGFLILMFRVFGGWAYKKEVMGMGDVYLIAMIGAFVGFPNIILAIFIGALIAATAGIIYAAMIHKKISETFIPFGPFLAFGGAAVIVFKLELLTIIFRISGRI